MTHVHLIPRLCTFYSFCFLFLQIHWRSSISSSSVATAVLTTKNLLFQQYFFFWYWTCCRMLNWFFLLIYGFFLFVRSFVWSLIFIILIYITHTYTFMTYCSDIDKRCYLLLSRLSEFKLKDFPIEFNMEDDILKPIRIDFY